MAARRRYNRLQRVCGTASSAPMASRNFTVMSRAVATARGLSPSLPLQFMGWYMRSRNNCGFWQSRITMEKSLFLKAMPSLGPSTQFSNCQLLCTPREGRPQILASSRKSKYKYSQSIASESLYFSNKQRLLFILAFTIWARFS
jgi:hypothetical protein